MTNIVGLRVGLVIGLLMLVVKPSLGRMGIVHNLTRADNRSHFVTHDPRDPSLR